MSKLKEHKVPLIILLIIVIACAGFYYYRQSQSSSELKLYGNVDVRQVSLAFNSSERIDTMLVEEGAQVKKGQLLATLKTETLKLNIAQSKANIARQEAAVERLHNGSRPQEIEQAEAQQREASASFENALLYKQRMDNLYSQSAISKQQLDDADAKYKAAKAALDNARAAYNLSEIGPRTEDIKEAEAQLEGLRANLAQQEYTLAQAELKAPLDGVIRSRLLEPGDMASPQKAVYTLTIDNKKWIRAYVSEKQLGLIHPGQKAKVIIDSFPDKPLNGEIGYISNVAEFTPKTVQTPELRSSLLYEVRIYVDDNDNVLRLGMPATVTLE